MDAYRLYKQRHNLYKSIVPDVPEDDMTAVSVTCYEVTASGSTYGIPTVTFTDYGEARDYFDKITKSAIIPPCGKPDPIAHAIMRRYDAGYWNLGGMPEVEFDWGEVHE